MDPISHIAFGRTLAALDRRRALGPGAIAACVIGSLAPDLDAVFMPIGWDIYLRRHQGGTHSLIGSIACAALTAAAVKVASRRSRYPMLWLAAWAGTAGHLLLDEVSGADVRFFWPLGPPVALPLFAMADPWLGGLLLLGLLALTLRKRSAPRIATAVLVAATLLAAGKLALYARVTGSDDIPGRAVQFRRAEVEWGSLTRWITYETRADVIEARRVHALTRAATPLLRVPRGLDDTLVVRSRELDSVQNFLAAHRVTFAIVISDGTGGREVLWSDLRYCGAPATRTAPRARTPWAQTPRAQTPWAPIDLGSGSPVACALWFGGEFDAGGIPKASIVRVGHLLQRRPIR